MPDQKWTELAEETSPADADILATVEDPSGSAVNKKITWANIKAVLKTYFDTLYSLVVKATGAELDTGTDDAKFATAKAIKDAHNVPSIAPGADGNVLTSDGTDWGSETPTAVPVKATGAEVDTGTDDAKFVTPKAVEDSKLIASDETVVLTNKSITPRVLTFTTDATPEVDSDDYDVVTITAQDVAITDVDMVGSAEVNFQKLIFRIKDDGTARAIAWGTDFEDAGKALPTTTVISKLLIVGFIYNTVTAKWGCVAVANET